MREPRAPDAAERFEALESVVEALAHRTRRHILLVIQFRGGEMTAGEIANRFSCSWPTVSRHLRVLEKADLVRQEKQGRTRLYRLNRTKLSVVSEWLRWFDGQKKQEGRRAT